jgi:hypothetical protein
MAKIIMIRGATDLINANGYLNRVLNILPKVINNMMIKWGNILVRELKQSAKNAGIGNFTGTLQKRGIRWEQKKRNMRGELFMRQYGIFLDSMNPHYVNVNNRRQKLLRWSLRAKRQSIRERGKKVETGELKKFSIHVNRHPFIDRGNRLALRRLNPMAKRMLNNIINVRR